MKKVIALLLCVLMLASIAAGCAKQAPETPAAPTASATDAPTTDEEVTLKVYTHRTDREQDGSYAKYIAAFNEKYPNIKIDLVGIDDYAGEMQVLIAAENYGDVFFIPDSIASADFSYYLEPFGTLDELKAEGYNESYLTAKYSPSTNTVYGLTYMAAVSGILYNTRVWKEAGITTMPTSREEFIEDLKLIKEKTDAIPLYTCANEGWTLTQYEPHMESAAVGNADYAKNLEWKDKGIFAKGGSHYNNYEMLFNIVAAGLIEDDPSTANWEQSKYDLAEGKIATYVLGSWAINQFKEKAVELGIADEIGYMPFPQTVDGVCYASSSCDYCYGISKFSEHKAEARAFIDFMLKESGMCAAEGGFSVVKDHPVPAGFDAFSNAVMLIDNPTAVENEGKKDEVMAESGIDLWNDNGERLAKVIEFGISNDRAGFDSYMEELNTRWAAAVDKIAG